MPLKADRLRHPVQIPTLAPKAEHLPPVLPAHLSFRLQSDGWRKGVEIIVSGADVQPALSRLQPHPRLSEKLLVPDDRSLVCFQRQYATLVGADRHFPSGSPNHSSQRLAAQSLFPFHPPVLEAQSVHPAIVCRTDQLPLCRQEIPHYSGAQAPLPQQIEFLAPIGPHVPVAAGHHQPLPERQRSGNHPGPDLHAMQKRAALSFHHQQAVTARGNVQIAAFQKRADYRPHAGAHPPELRPVAPAQSVEPAIGAADVDQTVPHRDLGLPPAQPLHLPALLPATLLQGPHATPGIGEDQFIPCHNRSAADRTVPPPLPEPHPIAPAHRHHAAVGGTDENHRIAADQRPPEGIIDKPLPLQRIGERFDRQRRLRQTRKNGAQKEKQQIGKTDGMSRVAS